MRISLWNTQRWQRDTESRLRRFVGGDRRGNNWLKVETANSRENGPKGDNCSSINDRCCHLWCSPDRQLSRVILRSNESKDASSRESGGPASRSRYSDHNVCFAPKKNAVFSFVLEHGGFVQRFRKLSSTDVRGENFTQWMPRFVRYQRSQQSASSIALLSLPPPLRLFEHYTDSSGKTTLAIWR